MRPYIICHMMASLDGRIDCDMTTKIGPSEGYYDALESFNCDAFVEGKVSREKHAALPGIFTAQKYESANEQIYKAMDAKKFAISMDTNGTLLWNSNSIDGMHLVCIVSEKASTEYLAYLKEKNISFIVTGKDKINIAKSMEILYDTFNVKRVAVVGGGHINGAFLQEGLLDELSMMYGAGIDGRKGMACAFDGLPQDFEPVTFKLESMEKMDGDIVWLKYKK